MNRSRGSEGGAELTGTGKRRSGRPEGAQPGGRVKPLRCVDVYRAARYALAKGKAWLMQVFERLTRNGTPVDLSWQPRANCIGVDPDIFFPERGASTKEAKSICAACIVRTDCLEYALENSEKFGIWGGTSERERRRLRRQRAAERRAKETVKDRIAV